MPGQTTKALAGVVGRGHRLPGFCPWRPERSVSLIHVTGAPRRRPRLVGLTLSQATVSTCQREEAQAAGHFKPLTMVVPAAPSLKTRLVGGTAWHRKGHSGDSSSDRKVTTG